MKKFLNLILIILIFVFAILASFMIYSNVQANRNSEEDLRKKVKEEGRYIDSNLILLFNALNNISYEDYKVQTNRIETASGSSQSSEEGGAGAEEGSGSGGENSGENESDNDTQTMNQSTILSNHVLNNSRDVADWNKIKQTAETLYSSWAVIELDLHALGGKAEDILSFSGLLKEAVVAIKNEEKETSLIALANCYAAFTKLVDGYETSSNKKQVFFTKSHILNAYAVIEQERWEDCATYLQDAENTFQQVMYDVSVSSNKQADVSKVYVLLKEMQESVNRKDADLFYINYKNAMQSIENLD